MEDLSPTLEEAVRAIQELPEQTQLVLAAEIMERVQTFASSPLTEAQRVEVRRRLAAEPDYVDEATVAAAYERFGVSK